MVGGKRPRSTMSRAQPIAAARAKREQKPARSSIDGENWGSGGDVVQELEVTIPEVGVRRRRAAGDAQERRGKSTSPSLDLSRMKGLGSSAGLRVEIEVAGEGRGIDLVRVHISIESILFAAFVTLHCFGLRRVSFFRHDGSLDCYIL
ncbi:hypothetical protein FRC08_003069 [Ceratobasidium sp. 394]|nr:hypothetical protein FRC08_003069 [Ceratobasidium sp. 394]